METTNTEWIVYLMCFIAIAWAVYLTIHIYRMNMDPAKVRIAYVETSSNEALQTDPESKELEKDETPQTSQECFMMMKYIAELISSGAITFLKKEYLYLEIFCILFAVILYFAAEVNNMPYTTVAFLIGAQTSMLCGYLGMRIATMTNWRTTYACNISIDDGFHVAFKGG